MRIKEKVFMDREGLEKEGPITIVAFGDSVTHGALAAGVIDYETVYHNILRRKINKVRNYVPVNVINAGIGGTCAKASLERMERDVFSHNPDLVIVCFGLNDVNGSLESYISSLKTIFTRCKKSGAETIFLTPNMLNTYVAENTEESVREYATVCAEYQNGGKMDLYMKEAKELAESMEIKVCDCYSKWRELSKTEDTTSLLINGINHPIPKMHELFADSLFEILFDGEKFSEDNSDNPSTMYKE